jgi:beta-propeller repeat-containing protein
MKMPINPGMKAHLIRGAFYLLLLLTLCMIPFALAERNSSTHLKTQMHRQDRSRTATSGDEYEAWVARYDGPGSDFDEAVALAVDNSGNVYVAGYSLGSGTIVDYATVKYNSVGQQEWVARYNGSGSGDDWLNAMTIDAFGNVYVTGSSGTADSLSDCTTIKYNSAGQELWVARHNVCPRVMPGGELLPWMIWATST